MQIPSYQISNVIKVYSKQLSQSRMINRQESALQNQTFDTIKISAEGKRQTLINQVSDEVFSRITKHGPQDSNKRNIATKLSKEIRKNQNGDVEKNNKFVFNFLGEDNKKVTNAISIEGSKVISRRLETLVRDNVTNDVESQV